MKKVLFILCVIILNHCYSQKSDSLRIYFQGIFHKEVFIINFKYIQDTIITKPSKYFTSEYIAFPVDSVDSFNNLHVILQIYRKSLFSLRFIDTEFHVDCQWNNEKYLIICNDNRLKKRYRIKGFWSDKASNGLPR